MFIVFKRAWAFFFLFFPHGTSIGNGQQGISYNVFRLCAGGDLAVQMLNLVPKPIRITDVQFSTNAPLAQNRCYKQYGLLTTNFKNGSKQNI